MFKKLIIPWLFCFASTASIFTQTYYFDNYSVSEGLAQNTIFDIIQDETGYIWMGSRAGAIRFDGTNVINFTVEDGLSTNGVRSLYCDSKGNIWFGHMGGKISFYDGSRFRVFDPGAKFSSGDITSIISDRKGRLWFTSSGSGAIMINRPDEFWDMTNYRHFKGNVLSDRIFGTHAGRDSTLYFVTDMGIKKLAEDSLSFINFQPPGLTTYFAKTCLLEDNAGNFWFGTYHGGLYKYEPGNKQFRIFDIRDGLSSNWISSLYEDQGGNIWAGTWGGGVTLINQDELTVFNTDNGLQDDKIHDITGDREGNVLLGTFEHGLSVYKGKQFISYKEDDGLINQQVWCINQDKAQNFWFGTNGGITRIMLSGETVADVKQFDQQSGLSSVQVRFIKKDKINRLWIGTYGGGILEYDETASSFVYDPLLNSLLYSDMIITGLDIDRNNILWAGTNDGILKYNINKREGLRITQTGGISGNEISSVYYDGANEVWIGARHRGLSYYDLEQKEFYTVPVLQDITPRCMVKDHDNRLWVGTDGQGLYVVESDSLVNHYNTSNGLLSNLINLITVDDNNNIFIGTNKGLNEYVSAEGSFIIYERKSGFTGIETKDNSVYKDFNGNIWFGTVDGAIKLNANESILPVSESNTRITGIKVNYRERLLNQSKKLGYNENNIIFEYINITLTNPDALMYQVKLEGADSEWQPPTRQNTATYYSLQPGKYSFMVRSRNSFGIWNEEIAEYHFQVMPPFYKSWWFILLMIISGVSLLILLIKIREKNLVKEKEMLEKKVRERTIEISRKNDELAMKNKDITDSIVYAKRIQLAILPPDIPFNNTFILFKPKDIVSGDFYWLLEDAHYEYMAAVDCTGHGVPGAFMSIIGFNSLNKIVKEYKITQPASILEHLNIEITLTLHQQGESGISDGMDISLVRCDKKSNIVEFAGAFNPMYHMRKGIIDEIKGDRFPVGRFTGADKKFTNHTIEIMKEDSIYLFSDGYTDQFGGAKGKKLKPRNLKFFLQQVKDLPMEDQGVALERKIEEWRGNLPQVDDILVIGRKF
ncbi:MAG: two-component regulator propeller domain-containing protein [Bacteroidales bacterium]